MEAYRSVIMEVFRDQFTTTELLSYKEVLYKEEWYAQRDPDKVDHKEHNCIGLAQQFGHLMQEYRETGFHLCTLSVTSTEHSSTSREVLLTHVLYIPVG